MSISGTTKIVGLIGDPVSHSISPAIHNTAFAEKGLDYCYVAFRVAKEHLPAAVEAIRALNIGGVNVTSPHKEEVVPLLDELSPVARILRAVNTIKNIEGHLLGDNTDGEGFLYSLKKETGIDGSGEKVFIFGAGGAAKAVAFALGRQGAGLTIANRTLSRAREFAEVIRQHTEAEVRVVALNRIAVRQAIKESTLLINALPLDPKDEAGRWFFEIDDLCKAKIIYDLRYSPRVTEFMRLGQLKGVRVFNGLGMLVGQGASAFKIFTGVEPPIGVMWEVAKKQSEIKNSD